MIRVSDHRRHIPIGVKLHACLLLLGFSEEEIASGIDWDHQPALSLRPVDPETGGLTPHPNDPRYLRPMRRGEHAVKTFGPGGEKRVTSAGGDIHARAHSERLARKQKAFRERMLAQADGREPVPKKGKRLWPSRPFTNRKRSKT